MRTRIAKTNKMADLALLEVLGDDIKVDVERPIIAHPKVDDTVCSMAAHPKRTWHCGEVSEIHRDVYDFTGWAQPGNSGSPMYNTNGELVGIATRYITCKDGKTPCGGGMAVSLWYHPEIMPDDWEQD